MLLPGKGLMAVERKDLRRDEENTPIPREDLEALEKRVVDTISRVLYLNGDQIMDGRLKEEHASILINEMGRWGPEEDRVFPLPVITTTFNRVAEIFFNNKGRLRPEKYLPPPFKEQRRAMLLLMETLRAKQRSDLETRIKQILGGLG